MKKIGVVLLGLILCAIGVGVGYYIAGSPDSAYEVAVKNGYTGTESQWLESLKGENGADGANGVNYDDVKAIYDELIASGDYTGSFKQFVKDYLYYYEADFSAVTNQCLLSAVSVSSYFTYHNQEYVAGGAGIIYEIDETSDEVFIVTNYHVVYVTENSSVSDNIVINLYGCEEIEQAIKCSFIGGSEAYDIAVLRVSGAGAQKIIDSDAREVQLGEYNDLTLGEGVFTIGNPKLEGISVCSGIISADNRTVFYDISSQTYYRRVFQFDAPINSGNSGGGIFNAEGRLIGIASSEYASDCSDDDVVESMSYGIPLTNVVAVAEYVIKNCDGVMDTSAKSYYMGIKVSGANSKAVYDALAGKTNIIEDVAIETVNEDSFAKKVGLEANDLLKAIKITKPTGEKLEFEITRSFMVKDIIMLLAEGDAFEIGIVRNGSSKTLTYIISAADSLYLKTPESIALGK